jgi:hypothetical protein
LPDDGAAVTPVELVALKDRRATLVAEIAGADKRGRDVLRYASLGDYALGSPRAIENAKARYVAAVAALEEFDRLNGRLGA